MTALSPFLPGTKIQFAWDSTSLGWLKTCPRLYQYSMIEGWRQRGSSVHLDFGGWYHSALELYDRKRSEGWNHDDSLYEVVNQMLQWTWVRVSGWTGNKCPACSGHGLRQINGEEDRCPDCAGTGDEFVDTPGKPWDAGHNLKTRETLVRSVIWYVEQFAEDSCETVQLANGKPAVELSFRMELDWEPAIIARQKDVDGGMMYQPQPYVLCGHLDRVVSFQSNFYVMDRKTSSTTIGSYYFDQYNPDNQMSLYTFATKVIYNTPVKGVIIDATQIAVGFTRFARGFTHRTDAQIEEWLANTRQWFRLAEAFATANFWPMNDKSCHQYGGCVFRDICSKDPSVRDKFLESGFTKRPWNPLEAR